MGGASDENSGSESRPASDAGIPLFARLKRVEPFVRKGKTQSVAVDDVERELGQVAEGLWTARNLVALADGVAHHANLKAQGADAAAARHGSPKRWERSPGADDAYPKYSVSEKTYDL